MTLPLEGGCLCGAVRYRIDRAPLSAAVCHCVSCRRAAGAGSVAWGTFAIEGFAWVHGSPAHHASSPGVRRTHCATCGTSLTYQQDPDSIDVTLASLDDPEAVSPASEIWLSHRLSWVAVDPGRKAYAESS